jgi:anaerobic dimethyl sulfoxide reductase subunit A
MGVLRDLQRWLEAKTDQAGNGAPFARERAMHGQAGDQIVRTSCPAHNCGGRCLLVAHLKDGVITRLESDDRTYDEIDDPRLLACARGKAYLRRQYHADRLLHPMKRVGKRGEGKFEQITWDQALDTVAGEIERIRDTFGNGALFVPYGTGSISNTNGSSLARRLLNLYGGHLGSYNDYSMACSMRATPTVYGTIETGNQRQDWINSRYVIMWGWNPAEMIDGTNTAYFLKKARASGAKTICIDPRQTMSAVALADEWVPIRPGTDAAMMSAMAHVIVSEGLHDADFVATHCLGFDATQMPAGAEDEESYVDYVFGRRDGIAKTPEWAEAITGVPARKIAEIARDYATFKPAMLYQGYGMQRRAYGEQVVRAGCALAAITGNVGIPGGWASGQGALENRPLGVTMPLGDNPVAAKIPVAAWTEAVLRGTEMGLAEGVVDAEHLDSDIKLIYAIATNCLINQHMNVNRSAEILRDESKVEFLVVQDQFLTPTGRFADILLPVCTAFETYGVQDGWKYGDEVLLLPQLVEPAGETKSDFRICSEIAARLGIGDEYTEGRSEREWVEHLISSWREQRFPDLPTLDEMEATNIGAYTSKVTEPEIAFADFRSDPKRYPLTTPSGLIEIFSMELHDHGLPDTVPAVPKYIEEWESPFDAAGHRYPLQAIGSHYLARVHSTHANNDWLQEAFPQRVFINPLDAADRGIGDGDEVRVFNDRGTVVLPCRLTNRIMPGVINIPHGAWWQPDESGDDRGGNVNVLTSERLTSFAFGNAQHTIMVQAEAVGSNDR